MKRRAHILVLALLGCEGDPPEAASIVKTMHVERRAAAVGPTDRWPVCATDLDGDRRDEVVLRLLRADGTADLGVLDDDETLVDEPRVVRESVGEAVACVGDVNGDGRSDVLVDGSIHLGGGVGLLRSDHGWEVAGDGVSLDARAAGDIDRDGRADLLVLPPDPARGPYVHLGIDTGVSPVPFFEVVDASGETREVIAADLNGDRWVDALFGGRWSAVLDGPSYRATTWQMVFWSWDLATAPPGRFELLETQTFLPTAGECTDGFGSTGEVVAVRRPGPLDVDQLDRSVVLRTEWSVPEADCRTRPIDTLSVCFPAWCEDIQLGVRAAFAVDLDRDGGDELVYVSGGVLWLQADAGSVPHPLALVGELGEVRELVAGPRTAGTGTLVVRTWTEARGEEVVQLDISLEDADGDGFTLRDCDDADPDVHPGAESILDNEVDEACDGRGAPCRLDADGDGFFGPTLDPTGICYGPGRAPLTAPVLDCDDTRWDVHPGVEEDLGGVDRDCDGRDLCAFDDDGDGYAGREAWSEEACPPLDPDKVGLHDCDDGDPRVHPGADDRCASGEDLDCDGFDGRDGDGDGWCAEGAGGEDCDDGDPRVHPGAEERWYDGVDADCAGDDDFDQDGDGHRVGAWGGADCDDEDAAVHPSAEEQPDDGRDSDCDGTELCFVDADGDGYRLDAPISSDSLQCEGRGLVSENRPAGDCDDDDVGVNPGARDAWRRDGEDRDCDPSTTPGCSTSVAPTGLGLLAPMMLLVLLRRRR